MKASAFWLVAGCAVLCGCGSEQRVASSATPSVNVPVASSPQASVVPPSSVAADLTESTVVVGSVSWTIESELGTVTYVAPPGTVDEVYPYPNLPEFVVGFDQWIVTDCCRLKVVLQSEQPMMADDELRDTFSSNGLTWRIYDTGPRDGTQIKATTTVGQLSVLVGVQNLFGDRPIEPSAADVARNVASTVNVTLATAP